MARDNTVYEAWLWFAFNTIFHRPSEGSRPAVLDCPRPVSFHGILRRGHLAGVDTVHYGIEFDLERSDDALRQQDAISRYVVKRRQAVRGAAKQA